MQDQIFSLNLALKHVRLS